MHPRACRSRSDLVCLRQTNLPKGTMSLWNPVLGDGRFERRLLEGGDPVPVGVHVGFAEVEALPR